MTQPPEAVQGDVAIHVRGIRPGEAGKLREVRLRALRDAPEAFTTSVAEAEGRPADFWETQAARGAQGDEWRIFFAEVDAGDVGGMAAIALDRDRPGAAEVFQMWVDPTWRGRSVGRLLMEASASWAGGKANRLRLGVASDNLGAIAFYQRLGFVETGESEPLGTRDGAIVKYLAWEIS